MVLLEGRLLELFAAMALFLASSSCALDVLAEPLQPFKQAFSGGCTTGRCPFK
jgi:hypothetical protein